MEPKHWQKKLIECITSFGWKYCGKEIRDMFDEASVVMMDDYAFEGCWKDEVLDKYRCRGLYAIYVGDELILEFREANLEYELSSLPFLRQDTANGISVPIVVFESNGKLFVRRINREAVEGWSTFFNCRNRGGVLICNMPHRSSTYQLPNLKIEYVGNDLSQLYVIEPNSLYSIVTDLVLNTFAEVGFVAEERRDDGIVIFTASDFGEPGVKAIVYALRRLASIFPSLTLVSNHKLHLGFGDIVVERAGCPDGCYYKIYINIDPKAAKNVNFISVPLSKLEKTTVKTRFNGYAIEIRNTYPLFVSVPVELGEKTYVIALTSENRFYADEQTELIIRGPDGTKNMTFDKAGIYQFVKPSRLELTHDLANDVAMTKLLAELGYKVKYNREQIIHEVVNPGWKERIRRILF